MRQKAGPPEQRRGRFPRPIPLFILVITPGRGREWLLAHAGVELEAAPRRLRPVAALADGAPEDVAQHLGECGADFRVVRRDGGQRAAAGPYDGAAVFLDQRDGGRVPAALHSTPARRPFRPAPPRPPTPAANP